MYYLKNEVTYVLDIDQTLTFCGSKEETIVLFLWIIYIYI